jgi:serine/threonine protein kinase
VGVVHLAVDTLTAQKKAIKIIPRGDCSDLSRLDTEIRIMMLLHHPNIVELEEVLESETNIFFIMEVFSSLSLSLSPLSFFPLLC